MPSDNEQSFFSLLLSHHPADKLHLCYRLKLGPRTLHLCARCSGLFPAMFLTLAVGQLTGRWPFWLEWLLLFVPPLPAFLDWGTTVATGKPERSNRLRLLSGAGLGVGLGASLHVNTYALLSYPVTAQLGFFLAAVWLVWLLSYARRSRVRREKLRQRLAKRPSLEEFLRQAQTDAEQDSGKKSPGEISDSDT